mgnify:CR=1 FL=1
MKKLILLLLLTSGFSFADITSEDERFTLLCQADKMTGFQWRDGEWQFTRYKPVMTIIKKHNDEKSAEDDGWVRKDAVNEMCAYRQSKGSKNTCYSIKQIGEKVERWNYVPCTESWGTDSSGNKKLKEVYCESSALEGKWEFQINGEFVAIKEPYGLSESNDGIKDDVYIQVGKCSLL